MSFRDLHKPGDPFILANAWDAGSARMLTALGAPAVATSSAAHAFTLGRPDGGTVKRDEALAHAQDMVAAVNVPVSGDFENGFGHAPEDCAETVRLSAEVGLAGISIEDAAFPDDAAYPFEEAVERIRAAAAAARALAQDFVLVARADGVMNGHYDIDEALRRVVAFDEAGADCLYVPLPKSVDDLKRVVSATKKPVNVLVAGPYAAHSREFYAALGAARLSLGSALARVTHKAIYDAGQAMFGKGDFSPLADGISGNRIDALLG
ncbi:MAG: isocitrate lyase/phosphoenolpyruvate mutase family protein [Pseudomonadota bacterium]